MIFLDESEENKYISVKNVSFKYHMKDFRASTTLMCILFLLTYWCSSSSTYSNSKQYENKFSNSYTFVMISER